MNTATIITVAIMAVALVVVAACMIRLGYKALLAEWAIEAITKADRWHHLQVQRSVRRHQAGRSPFGGCRVVAARKGSRSPALSGYGQHDSESGADDL